MRLATRKGRFPLRGILVILSVNSCTGNAETPYFERNCRDSVVADAHLTRNILRNSAVALCCI